MTHTNSSHFTRATIAAAATLISLTGVAAERPSKSNTATNAPTFGFSGLEIFPVDEQLSFLRAADLNGDGKRDLLVVNNGRSKINVLWNQTGVTNLPAAARSNVKRELNELPPDARFRIDSITSEKRISSFIVDDFNSDGRPDLAYYGEPREFLVQFAEGTNAWSTPRRWPLEDAQLTPNALASGDLNGDGRTDIALLADSHLYVFFQDAKRTLQEPLKIPCSGQVKAIQCIDLDGDKRHDLLLIDGESRTPFRVRHQNRAGELGPEVYFTFPALRSFAAEHLDPDGAAEITTIAQSSGRAQVGRFVQKEAEPMTRGHRRGQLEFLPLERTDKTRRGIKWHDVNGDGHIDLLVAQPSSGQIALYSQQTNGAFSGAKAFPSLVGVTDIEAADWDGDGRSELFVLSADERQLAISAIDSKGRLQFPEPIAIEGRPLAFAVGKLGADDVSTLAVISDLETNRVLKLKTSAGTTRTQRLGEDFKGTPSGMLVHDVDQDGRNDLLVLTPYERLKILLQTATGAFEELNLVMPGSTPESPWVARADIDGDGRHELLLPQRNFLRAVILTTGPTNSTATNRLGAIFKVKEQINGAANNSHIVAATALTSATNPIPVLMLLDAERKTLSYCERDTNSVWQVVANVPLPVTTFNAMEALRIGTGEQADAISLIGLNSVGWMRLSGKTWEYDELDGYETPIKDGRLNDVVAGDLNQDGRKDLVFMETAKSYVDIVSFDAPGQLTSANRWQVFEERTFRSRRNDLPEPREALIIDVTGDEKQDLLLLVHDRILLYPQE